MTSDIWMLKETNRKFVAKMVDM